MPRIRVCRVVQIFHQTIAFVKFMNRCLYLQCKWIHLSYRHRSPPQKTFPAWSGTVRSLETLSSPLPRSGHDLIGRAEEQGDDQGQGQGSRVPPEERLDYSRSVGIDMRDPRASGGICGGEHKPQPFGRGSRSGRNAHGEWIVCQECGIRLSYTPAFGATGLYRSAGPLPSDAQHVLENMKSKPGTKEAQDELSTREIAIAGAEASLQKHWDQLQRMKGARPKQSSKPKNSEKDKPQENTKVEGIVSQSSIPNVKSPEPSENKGSKEPDWEMPPHGSKKKPHHMTAEQAEEVTE